MLSAACGLKVAKHGNRSVSSKSGRADLLEFLGYGFPMDADGVKAQIKKNGFSFLFAPNFHPAMKHIAPIRQALKARTVFNILGPLTNPANLSFYLLGAFSSEMASLMASSLCGMVMNRAFVIHGLNGWDEPTPASNFELFDVREGSISHTIIDPSEYGIKKCKEEDRKGGTSEVNAEALLKVFEGKDKSAHEDALILNAGLALQVSGEAKELRDGIEIAKETIKNGKAEDFLSSLRNDE